MSEDWKDDEYLKRLDAYLHGGESLSLMTQLTERGWRPPAIAEITDEDLARELTNLIWSLKDLQVYITDTDHLSDSELYLMLLEYCHEDNMCMVGIEGAMTGWSPLGSWGEDETLFWLKYYATEDERTEHLDEYPEDAPLPDHEDPKYPRPWIPKAPF